MPYGTGYRNIFNAHACKSGAEFFSCNKRYKTSLWRYDIMSETFGKFVAIAG